MIRILLIVSVFSKVHSNVPLIFAAPSAVSHQSRIDVKHTPGFLSTPLIYSPVIYASHPKTEIHREAIIAPVLTTDTLLTPIALSFFHNLPLARALEHPISIEKAQESNNINEAKPIKGIVEKIETKETEDTTKYVAKMDVQNQNYGEISTKNNFALI